MTLFCRLTFSFFLAVFLLIVRLFNKGLDIIEVSDDGEGVPPTSRSALATPHATSKIEAFQDIYRNKTTFGFRGEALNSLANLSGKLVIATRTKDDPTAQKMEFRRDGSMVMDSIVSMPRKIGTTVAVLGLLQAVPVRRRDLEQRIQHHRSKLIQLVTGYAIFSTGVRVNLMDISSAGKEKTVLSTTLNSASLQDTVSSVIGAKFLVNMSTISIDLSQAIAASGEETPSGSASAASSWKVAGLISAARASRVLAKGQYFSINRRPVDLPKVARLLNETFRAFVGERAPSFVLEFTLPGAVFDVNLSPDKRQVLLNCETEIFQAIRKAVCELWASQTEGQFKRDDSLAAGFGGEVEGLYGGDEEIGDSSSNSRLFHRRYAFVHDPNTAVAKELDDGQRRADYESSSPGRPLRQQRTADFVHLHREPDVVDGAGMQLKPVSLILDPCNEKNISSAGTNIGDEKPKRPRVQPSTADYTARSASWAGSSMAVTPSPAFRVGAAVCGRENSSNKLNDDIEHPKLQTEPATTQSTERSAEPSTSWAERRQWHDVQAKFGRSGSDDVDAVLKLAASPDSAKADSATPSSDEVANARYKCKSFGLERFGFQVDQKEFSGRRVSDESDVSKKHCQEAADIAPGRHSVTKNRGSGTQLPNIPLARRLESDARTGGSSLPTVWSSFQATNDVVFASISDRLAVRSRKRRIHDGAAGQGTAGSIFGPLSEGSLQPSLTSSATTVTLSKDDFRGMTVVGQFNMGFILARSETGNLWILDQHACDEKYNFERLCRDTVLHEQTLIAPMALELSWSEETCVLDHMDIFEANGFRFVYDESKPPRHRLALTALPHSGARDGRNAVQYGKDDVLALISILGSDDDTAAVAVSGGTGTDGTGLYGNNAVRRYATGVRNGESADKIVARLPKTIAMLASRACRGSIMIGTALSEKEMGKIVKRMAEVEHPWNCPHGRPTMRHVVDLQHVQVSDELRASEHIAGPTVTLLSQDADL